MNVINHRNCRYPRSPCNCSSPSELLLIGMVICHVRGVSWWSTFSSTLHSHPRTYPYVHTPHTTVYLYNTCTPRGQRNWVVESNLIVLLRKGKDLTVIVTAMFQIFIFSSSNYSATSTLFAASSRVSTASRPLYHPPCQIVSSSSSSLSQFCNRPLPTTSCRVQVRNKSP